MLIIETLGRIAPSSVLCLEDILLELNYNIYNKELLGIVTVLKR